jgi:hypothetical protein
MELFIHDDSTPETGSGSIEWIVEEFDMVEHIGLIWENNTLEDYDGVFELPEQAAKLLKYYGVNTPDDMLPDYVLELKK